MKTEKRPRSWLVNELAKYMYHGFELVQKHRTIDDVIKFVDLNLNRMVYVREGGQLVGVAVYLMVTDLTLEKIISKEINLKDSDTFKEIEKENGENMHVFAIRADRMSLILKGTKDVFMVKKPKTISWLKPRGEGTVVLKRGGWNV